MVLNLVHIILISIYSGRMDNNMILCALIILILLTIMLIVQGGNNMGQGLANLQDAITKLQAQQEITIAALKASQTNVGDSDTAVQSAADAVNGVTAALAAATSVVTQSVASTV